MKKDTRRMRWKMIESIIIALFILDFPLVILFDLLDFGTNFTINMGYLGLSFVTIVTGFLCLYSRRSRKMRVISCFLIFFGVDMLQLVLVNYL